MNLSKLVIDTYLEKKQRMRERYEEIMNEMIQVQLSDEAILQTLKNELETKKYSQYNCFVLYLPLNTKPLFEAGKNEGLWVKTADGEFIDFSLTMDYLKCETKMKAQSITTVWEAFFKKEPILQNFSKHLEELFPDAKITGVNQCRWFESSGYIEFWCRVEIPLPA